MIKLIETFSVQYRIIPNPPETCTIFDQFSIGVLDKRYPKGSKTILNYFNLTFTNDVLDKTVKFIRKK